MTKPKNKKVRISDLARLFPNSRLLPPDDPIFDEPPGILFTGGRINREADENNTVKKKGEEKWVKQSKVSQPSLMTPCSQELPSYQRSKGLFCPPSWNQRNQ